MSNILNVEMSGSGGFDDFRNEVSVEMSGVNEIDKEGLTVEIEHLPYDDYSH